MSKFFEGLDIWIQISIKNIALQDTISFLSLGNFLPKDNSLKGKGGASYGKHGGFCAETQIYPDAINQQNFPDPVIRLGQVYDHKVTYKFTTVWNEWQMFIWNEIIAWAYFQIYY